VRDIDPKAAILARRRIALNQEWASLIQEIRESPGFEGFMLPPRISRILPTCTGGPVVIVNASRWTCDALALNENRVQRIPLLDLTLEEAVAKIDQYLRALQEFGIIAAQQAHGNPREGRSQYQNALTMMERILRATHEWAWERIAAPILDGLDLRSNPQDGSAWPRVWWCPTGPLTFLPLHAAGYHEDSLLKSPPTVVDRVISSYTPTIRALAEARARALHSNRVSSEQKLLIVSQDTPDKPLPNVKRERDLLTRLFSGRNTLLDGASATREAVSIRLPSHRWVHLSCHGTQDLEYPTRGGISLADGLLSVAELSRINYSGDFAFLSACKTGTGSVTIPDEGITLASALHYMGYSHVIAAAWSIWDHTAAEAAEIVYPAMMAGEEFRAALAPYALHKAVRALRDRYDRFQHPSAWSHFIHIGP
jgi:hypothetical protein